MTLLFLKKKKFNILVLLISVLFYGFNINKKEKYQDSFQKLCKNSDAYYLHTYTDVTYQKTWGSYKKYTSINNKLVVNNTNGVNEYAFLNLSEYESNHLNKIRIRTLKSNGTVVELDSSLVFHKKSKNNKFSTIKYPIPAVEPGDTIETSYVYYEYLKKNELASYASLHTDLPNKDAQYTIKSGAELAVRYKPYNNFPKPKIISNDTLVYLQFSLNNIKGFVKKKNNCFPCELPYLYYSLVKENQKLTTWKDVYNDQFNIITQPISIDYENSSYYKRWKRRVIKEAKDSSKYYKLNLLYSEVLENFKMRPVDAKDFIKSSGYFLKNKEFDPINIRRFYRQILEDLEINYWAVFGKSRSSGRIDPDFIRKDEYDHIFFAYRNEEGSLKLMYPHNDIFKYQMDEIPTSLYDTDAILVKPILKEKKKKSDKFISRNLKLAKVDSVFIAKIKLPGMTSDYNLINQMVFSKVITNTKEVTFKSRLKVSGGLSTELRSFFNMLNKNEEASNFYEAQSKFEGRENTIQIDSILRTRLNNKKPFTYSIDAKGVLNNVITFVNDSIVSFSINKLLQHTLIESKSTTSNLNYYLDYTYSDRFSLYIDFQNNIEVLGLENGEINYKNQFSQYEFDIKKTKKNQLRIKSNYKITENLILKENYTDLKLLNEQVKKAKSKRFIIKLKKK